MAQPPLLRPLFRAAAPTSSALSRRCFSQIPPLQLPPKTPGGQSSIRRPQPADRSVRVLAKMANGIPNDAGLLPGTFVTPTRSNRPSPFRRPGDYFSLLWMTLKNRLRDRASLLILKYSSPKEGGKRRFKIDRSSIPATAVGLHRQMYTAFAEGNIARLRTICASGILESLHGRISRRERGEKVYWELIKYGRQAKLVSDRAARLPVEGAAIRQAVVRIQSTQRLSRTKVVTGRRGEESEILVGGSGKEKDTVEYVVLQKTMEGWVDGDWVVWGTTKETTLEELREQEREALA